jgi:DNA repair ATPase RecN
MMSDDDIAEIRARHLREDRWCYSPSPQMHTDRATLLAEVDRQRAEIERLQKEADLTREALGGWALVPPDGGADPTHERVAAVVAEVEKQRADNERLTGKLKLVANALNETISKYHEVGDQNDRLDAENERLRAALEGKP